MKRYPFRASIWLHPHPWPWRRGWRAVLGHGLCFWLAPRLPVQLKEYVVRDALMALALQHGRPRLELWRGSAADLLWAYKRVDLHGPHHEP